MDIYRMKKTKKIVYVMGDASSNHSYVLWPFEDGFISKKGNRSDLRIVRNDNLQRDKDVL